MPYLRFVRMLADAAPHHPVVLAEAPHVALRLSGPAAPVDALAHALAGVLTRAGFSGATFVAHSYGTFVASRTRQLYPEVSQQPDMCMAVQLTGLA
jgi:pimeloyl-ACP methyl ester carboxylesterase